MITLLIIWFFAALIMFLSGLMFTVTLLFQFGKIALTIAIILILIKFVKDSIN